jgi:ADP-ribose pyrophosphatase YjhB (NUDIX family)
MDYIHELRKQIGPRKIILNCAGALIVREDQILLQRRTDNGRWGLIGGLVEMNETYTQAALREIREETGLEVKLDSFLGIFHNHNMVWSNGDAAHVICAMFTASIVRGEPRIDEESLELRFFGRNELPPLFAEDHIAALDAYFRDVRYPLLQENQFREGYYPSAAPGLNT